MPTAETAATATPEQPEPTAQTPGNPQRLLPAVDNAAWDTATPVEQTIDLEYLNTDSRMAALPALGTVERSHFDTVTFWATALPRAWSVMPPATRTPMCVPTAVSARKVLSITPPSRITSAMCRNRLLMPWWRPSPMRCISCSAPTPWSTAARTPPPSSSPIMKKMIDMFHESLPNVPIYVQSIPGVQEWVKDSKPGLQNDRIKLVNNLLANMALRKGCYFVNIAEALNQPDGSQIDEYEADGIHMQPVGYTAWCNYLATHTAWDRRNTYAGENPLYILGS